MEGIQECGMWILDVGLARARGLVLWLKQEWIRVTSEVNLVSLGSKLCPSPFSLKSSRNHVLFDLSFVTRLRKT